MAKINSILMVCLGNICRSPLAEGIARKICEEQNLDLTIDSCGTGAWHIGKPPCEGSIKVAELNGIDISSLRARQLKKNDATQFDLIVAMDESNYNDILATGFPKDKVLKLGNFGAGGADVPDPYYFSDFEGFHMVYNMVDSCMRELFEQRIL